MENNQFEIQIAELGRAKLPLWKEFPDFELYMDQLVNLGNRYLQFLQETEITPSMINSYVKKGLMHRPNKKRYNTANVAELVAISLLKSIYSLDAIKKGLQDATSQASIEDAYDYFATSFNQTLNEITNKCFTFKFDTQKDPLLLTEQFSIHAVIYKIIGEKLIDLLAQDKNH
ncbi:DUF1836 domain-containing protein [Liquorilactobacillus sicerae]|uniref:DUF1836 domain-containing protein n=1 Tax=Liquorilactobacillus sicerae TaxID=1416943 RepID=UPI002480E5D1|nr:DUF1836 domain-containing protein [Liquorilactobacillus sicerae]